MKLKLRQETQRRLRILQVTWLYFPYIGGVPTHVYEVATRLANAYHDVTILSTDPRRSLPVEELSEGVRLLRVPSYPSNRDYYFSPELYRVMRSGSWDIVHVQGINTLVAPLAMFAAIRAGLPFVLTPHTGHHPSRFRTSMRPLQYLMLKPLMSRAKKLIALNQAEIDLYRRYLRLSPAHFAIIPNGADLPRVKGPQPGASQPLIVSIGRLDRLKGHQRAIEALPEVIAHFPSARLRIVGEGDYEPDLRRLADRCGVADRVEIKGVPPWDRRGMAEILMQASLVTFFSDGENNPIAALEAVGAGRSVLVTHTSGLSTLADGGLARSIPLSSTPAQIAVAIVQQLGQPFVPRSVNLFQWQDCVQAIYGVYQEALSH